MNDLATEQGQIEFLSMCLNQARDTNLTNERKILDKLNEIRTLQAEVERYKARWQTAHDVCDSMAAQLGEVRMLLTELERAGSRNIDEVEARRKLYAWNHPPLVYVGANDIDEVTR